VNAYYQISSNPNTRYITLTLVINIQLSMKFSFFISTR